MVLEVYVIIGSLVIFPTENNIPKSMNTDRHLKKSFTDDTTIYGSETTLDETRKKATSELSKILDWLHANRLSLNINKTHFTIFGPQCSAHNYSSCTIRLNGQDIKHVNECKFLGIYLDTHSVFCPGFQKGRVPSEKGTFSAVNGPSKGHH